MLQANSFNRRAGFTRLFMVLTFGFGGIGQVFAQSIQNYPTSVATQNAGATILQVDPDDNLWQNIVAQTNVQGEVLYQTNVYTELSTGLNHLVNGQWVPSTENLVITQDGAAATNGQHQVYFTGNINTTGGVHLVTSDGQDLRSHIMGMGYYDPSNGLNVLFSQIQDSSGQILPSWNQALYTNAFTDVEADVRYSYTKSGLEQDIILRTQPPDPTQWNLNPQTTRLQIWTEFDETPVPVLDSYTNEVTGEVMEENLSFGRMQIGQGKAFSLQDGSSLTPVFKHWRTFSNPSRTFLVEEVPLKAIARQLANLPVTASSTNGTNSGSSGSAEPSGASIRGKVSDHPLLLAKKKAEKKNIPTPMRLAGKKSDTNGFVLDYSILSSATNFTFKADTTYYVSGAVNITGGTIEGGTVIKFTNSSSAVLSFANPTNKAAPYRMAVFTSKDDNSAGSTIGNSTGMPTQGSATYLQTAFPDPGGGHIGLISSIQYLRFAYAGIAISQTAGPKSYIGGASDCQFLDCGTALYYNIGASIANPVTINNSLFSKCTYALSNYFLDPEDYYEDGLFEVIACNLTGDQLGTLTTSNALCFFTNSIFTAVTNLGTSAFYNCSSNSGSTGFYQTVGAGNYYLANGSTNRNAGRAVSSSLAALLAQRTTHPPVVYSGSTIATNLALNPQAGRDTNASPDLGYHYFPIDYAFGGVFLTNSTLTASNGTVIGCFDTNGTGYALAIGPGSQFLSQGTPVSLNRIVNYNTVQEQPSGSGWNTPTNGLILPNWLTSGPASVIYCRFTDFSIQAQDAAHLYAVAGNTAPIDFQDCQFHGGLILSTNPTINLTNCLLERVAVQLWSFDGNIPTIRNNLFWRGTNDLQFPGQTNAVVQDNLFDETVINDHGSSNYFGGYNGYVTNYNRLTLTNATDKILTASPVYQTNAIGNYYLPTTSALVLAGSTNANLLGLYHYTTHTNEMKETNAIVDIGYHYVALSTNGLPDSATGDGIADYLADANGNGVDDPGEIPWNYAFILQPLSQFAPWGTSIPFEVTVTNTITNSVTYQWCFDGTSITGQTNQILILTNLAETNAGNYTAIAYAGSGSLTSAPAVLTICTPGFNAISNVSVNAGSGPCTISLTGITGGCGTNTTVSISASSSNPAIVSNLFVNYTNGNSTGTLLFTPSASVTTNSTVIVSVVLSDAIAYAVQGAISLDGDVIPNGYDYTSATSLAFSSTIVAANANGSFTNLSTGIAADVYPITFIPFEPAIPWWVITNAGKAYSYELAGGDVPLDTPDVLILEGFGIFRVTGLQPTVATSAATFTAAAGGSGETYSWNMSVYQSDIATSITNTFTVNVLATNMPPMVAITSPANAYSFGPAPTNLVVTATASTISGSISNVFFFDGTNAIGYSAVLSGGSYQISWNPVMNGYHSLTARALNSAGLVATSSPVAVTVYARPGVNISSPANNQYFGPAPTSVNLVAGAIADPNLANGSLTVKFYNGPTLLGTGALIADTTNYSFSWTSVPAGTYTITAQATDAQPSTTISAPVTFTVDPVNSPPVVNAGPNQTVPVNTTVFLAGSVSDDGLPRVDTLVSTWSVTSANGGNVTFANIHSPATTAVFSQPGIYSLQLVANDGQYSVTSSVVITAVDLEVNAGNNQTVVLPATNMINPYFAYLQPIPSTLTTNSSVWNSTDFLPDTDCMLLSVWYGDGTYNDLLYTLSPVDGTINTFNNIPDGPEDNIGTIKDTAGGFKVGETFCGDGINGEILRIEEDGSTVGTSGANGNAWLVLPNDQSLPSADQYVVNVYADRTGLWNGDLLVTCGCDDANSRNSIWRVNAAGQVTELLSTAADFFSIEALAIVPNDTKKYGPWAGCILGTATSVYNGGGWEGGFFTIDTNSTLTKYTFNNSDKFPYINWNAEWLGIIPTNQNVFLIANDNVGFSGVFVANAADCIKYAGDFLLGYHYEGQSYRVHWNGNAFEVYCFGFFDGLEGGGFGPCGVVNIASEAPFALLTGLVTSGGFAVNNPNVLWQQVSGPEPANFDNPTSLSTRARFKTIGTYDLRFSASYEGLSASNDVTITVVQNIAPQITGSSNCFEPSDSFTITNVVTDDGWPSNTVNVVWTKISGPGSVVFSDSPFTEHQTNFQAITTMTVTNYGTYVVAATASDGQASNVFVQTINVEAPILILTPSYTGPTPTGNTISLQANLTSIGGSPIAGVTVNFQVTGANPASGLSTGVTSEAGTTTLSYSGTTAGRDYVQATASYNGQVITSLAAAIDWSTLITCDNAGTIEVQTNILVSVDTTIPGYGYRCADYYTITAVEQQTLTLSVAGDASLLNSRGSYPLILFLKDANQQVLAFGQSGDTLNYTLSAGGTYTIEVASYITNMPFTDQNSLQEFSFYCSSAVSAPQFTLLLNNQVIPNCGTIDFGHIVPGNASTLTLSVVNTGTATLNLQQPSTTGSFSVSTLSDTSLAQDASTTVSVSFAPSANGSYSSTLLFGSDGVSGSPYLAHLTGSAYPNGNPPTVQFANPANGAVFLSLASIPLTVSVTAGDSTVSRVSFQATGTNGMISLGTVSASPYSIVWQNVPAGKYTVTASATDSASRTAISTPVTVTVLPPLEYQPPVAKNDFVTVLANSQNNPLFVLTNDTDLNPASLSIVSVANVHANVGVSIINNGTALSYTPAPGTAGGDWFTYTIQDATGLTASANVSVTIPEPQSPTVAITYPANNQTINAGTTTQLQASASGSGANVASVQFFVDNQPYGTVTTPLSGYYDTNWLGVVGNHSVYAIVTDTLGQMAQSASVSFSVTQSNPSYGPPIAVIANVTNQNLPYGQSGTPIIRDGLFTMTGQASPATINAGDSIAYQVNLFTFDGVFIANITSGTLVNGFHVGAVASGEILNTNDFTTLQNGSYQLQLVVLDTTSYLETTTNVAFVLDSNLKIGQFGFNQQDLIIPVNGLPLQVTRTYNSFNPVLGDFGYGWTYAICDLQVALAETRRTTVDQSGDEGDTFSMRDGGSRDVTLTLPNGQRTTFYYYLAPGSADCTISGVCYTAAWQAAPGVTATLTPQGDATMNFILEYAGTEYPPFWDAGGLGQPVDVFDIQGWILQTEDGTKYYIDRPDLGLHTVGNGGEGYDVQAYGQPFLSKIVEPTLDSITVSTNGVSHYDPNGALTRQVVFQHQNGLLTGISDPNGLSYPNGLNSPGVTNGPLAIIYQYDNNTNLLNVLKLVDANANGGAGSYVTNTFAYTNATFPHYITGITDADGNTPLRSLYDDSGRLIATIDAFGHTNNFSPILSSNLETVVDRRGNSTTYIYDNRGNVTDTFDALNDHTSKTYDASNNVLSSVDALSNPTYYAYDGNNDQTAVTNALGYTNGYVYDGNGRLLISTDSRGFSTTNIYDSAGNLRSNYDALGELTLTFYDSANRVLGSMDADGDSATNQYDASGNILGTQMFAPDGVTIVNSNSFTYDNNGNRLTSTVWRHVTGTSGWVSATTTYVYDGQNRVIQTIDPYHNSTYTVYDGNGLQIQTEDKLGNITEYQYDALSRLTNTIYPDLTTESTVYDANGNRTNSVDRLGRVTTYVYDALNRLEETVYPDNTSNSTIYDANGRVAYTVDALGVTNAFGYDAIGEQIAVTNGWLRTSSNVMTFAYDPNGNRTITSNSLHIAMTNIYDGLNRVATNLFADQTDTYTTYDPVGRKVAQTDQAGLTTLFGYDGAGRLISVTNALQKVTKYVYDEAGNQTQQIDAMNRTTVYTYDDLGRRTQRALPSNALLGTSPEAFGYDANGNLLSHTDFNGLTVTNNYDSMNRLMGRWQGATQLEAYGYDLAGQMTSRTDVSGAYSWVYDLRGRLRTNTTPVGTLYYTYDFNGNQSSLSSATTGGVSLVYQYDDLNRLTNVIDHGISGLPNTGYAYDPVGNLQILNYPNGVTNLYQYDLLNRLTNLVWEKTGAPLASFYYKLSLTGTRMQLVDTLAGTFNWGYDNTYRMTSEALTSGTSTSTLGYVFDDVGNRTARTGSLGGLGATTSQFDVNDFVDNDSNPDNANPWFDSNGNTLTDGTATYGYDYANRLNSMTKGSTSVNIVYGADDNRTSKTVSSSGTTATTSYLVATVNPTGYPQVVEESTSSGGLSKVYSYGLSLISQRTSSDTFYFGTDGHGSTRFLTDTSETVPTFTYDAYGNLINPTSTSLTSYLYTGEQFDSDLGMDYLRARYYQPDTGRFWTMDTYEGNDENPQSLHKYLYCSDNPLTKRDPSGNDGVDFVLDTLDIYATWGASFSGPVYGPFQGTGGPDVTAPLNRTLLNVQAAFWGWTRQQKLDAASQMRDLLDAAAAQRSDSHRTAAQSGAYNAWDIIPLFQAGWKGNATGEFSVDGKPYSSGTGSYRRTVGFNGNLYYASAANYALWGTMNRCVNDWLKLDEFADDYLNVNEYSLNNAVNTVRHFKHYQYSDFSILEKEAEEFTGYGFNGTMPKSSLPCNPSGVVTAKMFNWCWEPVKPR